MNSVLHLNQSLPAIKFKTIIPFAVALALAAAGFTPGLAETPWWARDFDFGFLQHSSAPRFDLKENDKQLMVSTEIPGFEPTDINVEVTRDSLSIKAKKSGGEAGDSHEQVTFERSLRLPTEIDPEQAEASLKNGVLKVMLPKSAPEKIAVRKLTIKTN